MTRMNNFKSSFGYAVCPVSSDEVCSFGVLWFTNQCDLSMSISYGGVAHLYVKTSRGNIGGNEHSELSISKPLHRPVSQLLTLVSVKWVGCIAQPDAEVRDITFVSLEEVEEVKRLRDESHFSQSSLSIRTCRGCCSKCRSQTFCPRRWSF